MPDLVESALAVPQQEAQAGPGARGHGGGGEVGPGGRGGTAVLKQLLVLALALALVHEEARPVGLHHHQMRRGCGHGPLEKRHHRPRPGTCQRDLLQALARRHAQQPHGPATTRHR
jgi:hypothetical protein